MQLMTMDNEPKADMAGTLPQTTLGAYSAPKPCILFSGTISKYRRKRRELGRWERRSTRERERGNLGRVGPSQCLGRTDTNFWLVVFHHLLGLHYITVNQPDSG